MRAAIYTRISRDRDGTSLGVQRQEKLCREIITQRKWSVAAVHTDNDVSATKGTKRPGYERMLAEVRAGQLDVIVALDSDRLLRRPLEFEQLAEIGEPLGLRIEYQSGRVDFRSGEGVMEARIRAAVDAEEVAKLKKRVRRKARERAEAGEISGGGTRPFGFHDHDAETNLCRCCEPGIPSKQFGVTVRDDEAAHIRLAVRRIIDNGWTFYGVTADWNERGIVATSGKPWKIAGLKRMLLSPRIAGLRQHKTVDSRGNETVETFRAVWPEIISEEDHELLVKRGERPPRRKNGTYLLTGVLFTAEGEKMVARPKQGGERAYFAPGYRSLAVPLEDYVTEVVLTALEEQPKLLARLTERKEEPKDRKIFRQLDAERGRLDRLRELYLDGDFTKPEYEKRREEGERKVVDLENQLDAERTAPVTMPRSGGELRAWWENASVIDRRVFLSVVLKRVTLDHAVVGRNFFDRSRVGVEWAI
jgi:DNA invertase Pin-like site-specific DNA recombinase